MNKTGRKPWLDGAYIPLEKRQSINNEISKVNISNGPKCSREKESYVWA